MNNENSRIVNKLRIYKLIKLLYSEGYKQKLKYGKT